MQASNHTKKKVPLDCLRSGEQSWGMNLSRPDKLTHLETIFYEIDMLRYSASKLESRGDWERWSFLECFLLHFRNLLEFFGSKKKREDDLSVSAPQRFWPNREIPLEKLKELQRNDLWEQYEGRGDGRADTISRYLQHCTEQRVEVKSWNIQEMLRDITPLVDGLEDLLPSKQRRWGQPPKSASTLSRTDFSTATIRTGYKPV